MIACILHYTSVQLLCSPHRRPSYAYRLRHPMGIDKGNIDIGWKESWSSKHLGRLQAHLIIDGRGYISREGTAHGGDSIIP